MFRKIFSITSLIFLLFLTACSGGGEQVAEDSSETESNPIRMLYSEWPPDMMAYLAQEMGLFEKYGVDVELVWVDGFEDAQEVRRSGGTDIWNYTLLDFLTEYADGTETDAQIFLVEDISTGADAVVTMPDNNIKSIADLEGKKIGVETGTIGEFFLQILLQKEELTLDDVDVVDMAFDDITNALLNDEIAAGVTYEPGITDVVSAGGEVLIDSSDERGAIVDVYVAKRDDLAARKAEYEKVALAILEAGEYYYENTKVAADIIKGPLNMTTDEVIETFELLEVADLRSNQTAFNRSSGYASLHNLGRAAQQFLEGQGILKEYFDIDPLINSGIVDSLQ